MKLNRIAGMALASLCFLYCANASADTVAVMKLDAENGVDKQADYLLNAIRKQVEASSTTLDSNGADITYTEMQMVTGCDKEGSIACYDAACETLGSPAIIFGSVKADGSTQLVWYINGKGIFREIQGRITDKESAEKLAKKIVIGDVGKLIVTSNIPGADVFVDGKRVGMSAEFEENAQPIELVTGNYVVAVRKDGYSKEDAVKVIIESNSVAKVHIDMSVARDPEDTKRAILIAGYSSLGVGVASLITGGVLTGLTCIGGESGKCGTGSYIEKEKIDNVLNTAATSNNLAQVASDVVDGNKMGRNMSIAGQALLGIGGFLTAAGIALVVTGYVYDFAGEDVDKIYSNKYMPKVNFNLSQEYQGMNLGWTF